MKFDVAISREQVKHFIIEAEHRVDAINEALKKAKDINWDEEKIMYETEYANIIPHITRKNNIKIGDKIFDTNKVEFGIVLNIIAAENGFVYELIGDSKNKWLVEDKAAYQIVPDKYCHNGHLLCYEHNDEIEYPYYCPFCDENMYEYETIEKK